MGAHTRRTGFACQRDGTSKNLNTNFMCSEPGRSTQNKEEKQLVMAAFVED